MRRRGASIDTAPRITAPMNAYPILHHELAAVDLTTVTIDAPTPPGTLPGQYLRLRVPEMEKPSFFAIASIPDEPLTLLVKGDSGVGRSLSAMRPGQLVEVSAPEGPGFALDRIRALDWVVYSNGSGLSAVRPVILTALASSAAGTIHLIHGVLSPDRCAWTEQLQEWASRGVRVHVVAERAHAEWTGPRGWVQDHAQSLGLIRPDVGVVLVGVPAMIADVKQRYTATGCPAANLLTNF
jgi:NAD(P)H-flavin reductase